MDKAYVPVLSAVAGGLLTVIGGFVVNYLLQSAARRSEKTRLLCEKLEEAYLLSHDVDAWVVSSLKQMVLPSGETSGNTANPIRRVVMLIKLYEPSLSQIVSEFSDSVETFASCTFTYWKETFEANSKLSPARFESITKEPLDSFHSSHEKLLASIEEVIQKQI